MDNLLFLPGASGSVAFWQAVMQKLSFSHRTVILTYPEFGGVAAHPQVNSFADLQDYILTRIVEENSIHTVLTRESSVQETGVAKLNVAESNTLASSHLRFIAQESHPPQETTYANMHQDKVLIEIPVASHLFTDPNSTVRKIPVESGAISSLTQSIIVAQSMGGIFAVQAALKFPHLVKALVLVATSGGIDLSAFNVMDWRQQYQRDYAVPNWFVGNSEYLDEDLSKIRCPVLLIWGDADPISPPSVGRYLVSKFINAELHIISGGQHDLANVFSTEVSELIRSFLQLKNHALD